MISIVMKIALSHLEPSTENKFFDSRKSSDDSEDALLVFFLE